MEPISDSGNGHLPRALAPGESSSTRWQVLGRVVASWDSLLAFLAPLLLYRATMAPTLYNLDSAEFTTAAYTGGLVRATGYPLYLAVGRIWSRIPIGDVGFRMNLLSAVCGALTLDPDRFRPIWRRPYFR